MADTTTSNAAMVHAAMSDTNMPDTSQKSIAQPDGFITNGNASGSLNPAVATDGRESTDRGNTNIAEQTNNLKRDHDDSEDDNSEDANGESDPKRACTDASSDDSGPEVFAKSRQALCESFPSFRAYNSSLYTQKGVARGFYMDGAARPHDQFKGQVIISSVGGGRVLDEATKKMTRVDDMSETNLAYKAFQKAKAERALIPVIAGSKHCLWPTTPPHNFNVLDYFVVTDVWAELNVVEAVAPVAESNTAVVEPSTPIAEHEPKTIRVFCFRMEKANLQKHSWWDHNPTSYVCGDPVEKRTCASCHQESKRILQTGWTCVNHHCETGFFRASDGKKITQVAYSDAFLQERSDFIGPIPAVKPTVSSAELNGIDLYGSEAIYRAGIVCDDCGSCTSRVFWNRWACEHCNKEVRTDMVAYPKELVKAEVDAFKKTVARLRKAHRITENQLATKLDVAAVKHCDIVAGLYKVSQFLLPDPQGKIIGSVTVFRATEVICERGPDLMFDALSTADIGLRRNTVSGGDSRTQGLSRHFQQNWGAKYKFAVDVQSKGFEEAPDTILQAVQQLKWAGTSAVPMAAEFITSVGCDGADIPDANVDFNECLSLGYMTNDRINYHDDGEKQCGPTVATLSLGSPAMMAFRPKKKSGMSEAVSAATRPKVEGREYSDVLAFPLYHGDLLVMNGTLIHRYYEHKVEPSGGRRFALTCRYMDPSRMATDEERRQAEIKGTMPAHADKFVYNGDGYLTCQNVLEQSPVAQDTLAEDNTQEKAGAGSIVQQDTAVLNTVDQDTAVGDTTQHGITAQQNNPNQIAHQQETTIQQGMALENIEGTDNENPQDTATDGAAVQHSPLERSTLGRYNFRVRKAGLTYKFD